MPKSDKGPGSNGKKEKIEIELTRQEKIDVLKTHDRDHRPNLTLKKNIVIMSTQFNYSFKKNTYSNKNFLFF